MMQRIRWNKQRAGIAALSLLLLYLGLTARTMTFKYSRVVDAKPKLVWDYVADFSNIKKINPSILDFSIIDESGTYDKWSYSVTYTERLSQWPYLYNVGHGHFSVRPINEKVHSYIIESKHNTCFFSGFLCYKTVSDMTFKPTVDGKTTCEETVQYQCPGLFALFCKSEVSYQRTAIMNNLRNHFTWKH
ncbi:uncharacterized protein LOC113371146 [Ctenocephalides felis]|uniref:uncharacterized protein LOC113371144 n=1 Tax=Ctenocephalides felis TaxID=7515 RepID=UPI000E6E4354|nr:uncharacterized protein LOC113371144 [Ctenocephalides felis]XP_026467575.1 uncharacterized protein LOC113371146 [Ctenocephalides felis]